MTLSDGVPMRKPARISVFLFFVVFLGSTESAPLTYSGDSLRHLHIPVGGIGTGNVLLGGRGNIQELQLFNTPQRDELRPLAFFALRVQEGDSEPVLRICERRLLDDFHNPFGVPRQTLTGCPRFAETFCSGTFPVTEFEFKDSDVPVKLTLTAYNPFIPLDVENSSLPAAFFNWKLVNPCQHPVEVSLCFNLSNVLKHQNRRADKPNYPVINRAVQSDPFKGVYMQTLKDSMHTGYGELIVFTTDKHADIQTRWHRGSWWDHAHLFWLDFRDDGRLQPVPDAVPNEGTEPDIASILVHRILMPGDSCVIPFVLTWYIPWRIPEASMSFGNADAERLIRNHYTLNFSGAQDVAEYVLQNQSKLYNETHDFQNALYSSTFPAFVIDALAASTVPLKTHLLTRASDRHVHGFEGLGNDFGCCPGNCTHVWNYAQTLAFLFPQLERDMRETAWTYATFENGYQCFRTPFPVGNYNFKNIAADGQMGNIMRVYREWKYCGDGDWLRSLWPGVKDALEFAWKGVGDLVADYPWMKNCPVPWDPDKQGVLRGDQHNTYDCNFFGMNMMTGSLYLGALRACIEMAGYFGDSDKKREYQQVYEQGRALCDSLLWNGEYYFQRVELIEGVTLPDQYTSPDGKENAKIKYQYGEGCLSDQLLGQYLAWVTNLGVLTDSAHVQTALNSIYKYNFQHSFEDFENVQRVYALNKESGLVICSWPNGNRPAIPFPYADEVWTGIEYQVAASLIYAGEVEKGLDIVEAVRGRYSGYNRDPFAEIESGRYYARSMAAWALLTALSGYEYDAVQSRLAFHPRFEQRPFRSFWSCGSGWGVFVLEDERAELTLHAGEMSLKQFGSPFDSILTVTLDQTPVEFRQTDNNIKFDGIILTSGDTLEMIPEL